MLGDASLQTQNKGINYRMKFEWAFALWAAGQRGDRNKVYLEHVYNLFDEWVLTEPHKKVRTSPNPPFPIIFMMMGNGVRGMKL